MELLRLWTGRRTLGELPAVLDAAYGSRVAIEAVDRTWTYTELADRVRVRARDHSALSGQTVLLRWENDIELLIELLALSRAGAVVAPVGARLSETAVQAIAEATHSSAAVVGPGLKAPSLCSERMPPGPGTAVLLATSGTTGRPKAAALTHRGLISGLAGLLVAPVGRTWGPRSDRDAVLSALPLAHVMGLFVALATLCAGVPWIHRARFEAEAVLDLLERRRPNVFVGVPTMYADLEAAGAATRDLRATQLWISGADAMPTDRARRFQKYGAAVVIGGRPLLRAVFVDTYGMVELSGPAAFRVLPPIASAVPIPYRVRSGLRVRAVAPDGRPLPYGRTGELAFRGSSVMRGYRGQDDGLEGGWLRSGDHGRVFPGGLFVLDGRDHDRLKVGGFSVFPAEVEAQLDRYPGVREVVLVGLPDPRLGERPVALVVPAPGFDPDAFLTWAREQVAGYRRPREVFTVGAIPRGGHAKLDRKAATRLAERLRHPD